MKKAISLFLVSVMALSIAGCGTKTETDEYGNTVEISGTEYTVYPQELPYTIDYNGEPFELTDVRFYQSGEDDWYYDLYVIAVFDISELSRKTRVGFEYCITPSIRLTCEANELDNSVGRTLGRMQLEDTDTMVFVFSPPEDLNDFSFGGTEARLSFSLSEDEGDYEKVNVVYTTTAPEDIISDNEIMTDFSWDLTVAILGWKYN